MNNSKVKRMVGIAILMAVVVVLQLLGQFIKLGPMVSVSLVLLPIVIGAAVYGPTAGAILGATFSVVVLLQPDTGFFYGISVLGTVVTVMAKGILSGWLSGLAYKALEKKSVFFAVALAAVICPIVNTGLFFLGCITFFYDGLASTGVENVAMYVITMFIGFNFIAEFVVNVLCCPVAVRLLHIIRKK